ncbi:MAG: acetyl-CoA carboxylase biotin carboxyl carrier protein [Bacteroidota bacterium]
MEFKEIQDLLKLVNRTNLTEVEIEKDGLKLKIKRKSPESNVIYTTQQSTAPIAAAPVVQPPAPVEAPQAVAKAPEKAAVAAPEETADTSNLIEFRSPMIGTFYRSASPEADSFVNTGDTVKKGQVLCIIEAMKLFNEIESEVDGKIVKILVENAQPVEYDQVLFLIDPNA